MLARRPFVTVIVAVLATSATAAHGDREDRRARNDRDDDGRKERGGRPGPARPGPDTKNDDKRDDADEPLVAVVRVATDDDAAVLARIEGQTSDLSVTLRVAKGSAGNGTGTARDESDALAEAHALAARYKARVVVWFRRDRDAWIVYVAEPEADRVLIRRIATDGGKLAGSASAEAAALVVRTALRALAAGGSIGVEEPAPPPPPPPAPTIEIAPPPPPPPPRTSAVRPLRPYGALLSRSVVDGAADFGQHGFAAQLGAAGGPFRVAAAATYLPAVAHRKEEATIEVERVDLGVALGMDLVGRASTEAGAERPDWRLTAELGLGIARYRRTTTEASDPLTATPDTTTWAATVSPAARIARRIGHGAWIELALGIDLIANAPEFGVVNNDIFRVHTRLWPAEPHAGLGLLVDVF